MWQLRIESAHILISVLEILSATNAATESRGIITPLVRLLIIPSIKNVSSTGSQTITDTAAGTEVHLGHFHKIKLKPPLKHGSHSDTNSSNLLPFPKLQQ